MNMNQRLKSKDAEFIPLDYKKKSILLKNILKEVRNHCKKSGCSGLLKEHLLLWKECVKNGGNKYDKFPVINSRTYDRYVQVSRQNYEQVITRNMQE